MAIRIRRLIPNFDPQDVLTKVDFQENLCWSWQGNIDQYGYGTYGNQNYMVHRVVYTLLVDDLKSDDSLDHLCMNRACVNPDHLELTDMRTNVLRSSSPNGINARKTHCVRGHKFDDMNTYIHPKRGTRLCRQCQRINSAKYRLINKE